MRCVIHDVILIENFDKRRDWRLQAKNWQESKKNYAKTVQARITKSSPSGAWKTLVSGTVKLFHKFEGGHPKQGR